MKEPTEREKYLEEIIIQQSLLLDKYKQLEQSLKELLEKMGKIK